MCLLVFLLLTSINNLFHYTLCVSQIASRIWSREHDCSCCKGGRAPWVTPGTSGSWTWVASQGPAAWQSPWEVAHFHTSCRGFVEASRTVRYSTGLHVFSLTSGNKNPNLGGASAHGHAHSPVAFIPRPAGQVARGTFFSIQGSEGLYIMPTHIIFIESNSDDYICNLIKATLFLEFSLKAWEEKRQMLPLTTPEKNNKSKPESY